MKNLPPIRTENIVVQEIENEVLVYDLSINKAFCLNETSAKIYNACGENQTFADLRAKYNYSDDLINFALDDLQKNNLLAENYNSPISQINRREVIKKIGLASMVALPVISNIIAPSAARAASGSTCTAAGVDLFGGSTCGFEDTAGCQETCDAAAVSQCCSGEAQIVGTCPACTCRCMGAVN